MESLPLRKDWQGKLIGRYQLENLLGRGALSEVWLATDTQLRRQVAMKILPTAINDQAYLRAFIYEARAAASLEHPHILGIHDFGEQEIEPGEVLPYLVMPYVAGGTLFTRMKEATGPLAIQESLRYLRQAALAIDYAHSKRILHRDIKPANMLLRDDWLLLTDFGLAKVLGGTMMRSQTYAGSGTPEYMAPEQIMGQALPASDRYSLAVVAYQLFTGTTPFHGSTPAETITQQMQAPLPSPRQLNPRIPITVENLLTIALSRNPELRPPSCLALVDALQKAWMTGVQTEPDPEATLLAPWSKRGQEMASAVSAPAVAGGTPTNPFWPTPPETPSPPPQPADQVPPLAQNEQTLTDSNRTSGPPTPLDPFATNIGADTASSAHHATNVPQTFTYQPGRLERKVGRRALLLGSAAAAVVVVGGGAAALAYMRTHADSSGQPGLAAPTQPPGPRKLIPGQPLLQLTGHTSAIWTADWHPGGRYLLTAAGDGFIMLWDIATALQNSIPGTALAVPTRKWTVAGVKFENITDAVCWSKDGKKVIVGNSFGDKAYVLDAFGPSNTPTIYRDIDLSVLGDSAIYANVAAGPSNDSFTIVNSAVTGAQAQLWRFGQTDVPALNYDVADGIDTLRWSPNGNMLAATTGVLSTKNGFYLWQRTNHTQPRFFARPQRDNFLSFAVIADTLAWSPTDPHLVLVSDADEALIWDVRKEQPLLTLSAQVENSIPEISRLSWSPNGRYVAASYDPVGNNTKILVSPKIFVWDIQTLLKSGSPSAANPPSFTFSAPTGSPTHTQAIIDLNWSPDGRYLATSSFDKSVIIWKVSA